ncbi:MAG: CHAT domain-containing protein [Gammaproteobacteria bacterium]|nr:CHAT domain-containing protein [Gammaproteobacteria bacterium]
MKILLLPLMLFLSGCALIEGAPMLTHVVVKELDEQKLHAQGISQQDMDWLKTGHLQEIRDRYESLPSLTITQQRLLCDIYVKQMDNQASECLDKLEAQVFRSPLFNLAGARQLRQDLVEGQLDAMDKQRLQRYITAQPMDVATLQEDLVLDTDLQQLQVKQILSYLGERTTDLQTLLGKRALLQLQDGHYVQAAALSQQLSSFGGRYIHALAQLQLGQRIKALETAHWLSEHYETEPVYLGANLYLAAGEYQRALDLAQNKARRLAIDYGLRNDTDLFGGQVTPADFRFDLFDEFRFGLLDFYSYAPRANAYVEFIIAKSEFELGRLDQAKTSYDLILSTPGIDNYRDIYWLSLFDRGRIAQRQNNLAEAEHYFRQAIDVIEAYRSAANSDITRLGMINHPQQVYAELVELLIGQERGSEAFTFVERARNREAVDWANAVEQFADEDIGPQDAMQRFVQAEKQLLSGSLVADPAALSRTRSAHRVAREEIRQSDLRYKNLVTIDQPTFASIKQRVGKDETIVTYYTVKNTLYAFVLNLEDNDLFIYRVNQPLPDIVKNINKLRRDVARAGSDDYINSAASLYDSLIRPIQPKLNKKRITFSVNGDLLSLPFATLFDGQSFLVQRYRLSVIPNVNVINQISRGLQPAGNILIVGNPDRGPEYDLPYAQMEANLIRDSWTRGQSTVQLGHVATVNNFQQVVGRSPYVHIAAHAVFDSQQPVNSRILFARPLNSASEKDWLSAGQLLSDQRFALKANLVVLSGCETAVASDSEQLNGLSVSFLYAGANSVIGSLWTVDDRATSFLMERFYNRLDKGFVADSALQNAQLATLEQFPHPYYWAAFQYTGHNAGIN